MLKIQFLNGGLANQAFQYIFAKHYELSHPGEIMYLDDSYFALNTVHNGYELEKVFGIKAHMLSEAFDADVWQYMLKLKKTQGKSIPQILKDNDTDIQMVVECEYQNFNPFDGEIFRLAESDIGRYVPQLQNTGDKNIYYHGYWLNKGWFDCYREYFWKEFQFPELTDDYNKGLLDRILNEKSVSLHVRRGDYVDLNWAFDETAYHTFISKYIQLFGDDFVLFVFSDDIAWCKEKRGEMALDRFKDVVFVEGNKMGKNYIDLQLMANCEGMINDKSAFPFLAALLNQRRRHWINVSDHVL